MIWTLIIVLLLLWALGFGTATAGSLIHLLLLVVVILFLLQIVGYFGSRSGPPPP